MSETITIRGQRFVVYECITCGVVATCPEVVLERQRQGGGYHSCPNGHQQGWSKEESDDARVRRERDRLKQQLAQKDDEIAEQRRMREEAERSASAARGQVTKLRNRAKAGLCPCCNRHFTNLERHMATKHADEPGNVVPLRG